MNRVAACFVSALICLFAAGRACAEGGGCDSLVSWNQAGSQSEIQDNGVAPDDESPPPTPVGRKSNDPLKRALGEKFPKAPVTLDTEPGFTGLVLLDTKVTKPFKVIGAILERRSNGEMVRASRFQKDLILFHDLEPGTYALRLLKVKDFMANKLTVTVSAEVAPTVDVGGGAVHYLGVVRARIKTIFNSTVAQEYDGAREMDAWEQFKEQYVGSPWLDLVDRRIAAIQSQAEQ